MWTGCIDGVQLCNIPLCQCLPRRRHRSAYCNASRILCRFLYCGSCSASKMRAGPGVSGCQGGVGVGCLFVAAPHARGQC